MADNTRDTVLDAFRLVYPNIRVEGAEELAGAFQGGAEGFLLANNQLTHIELIAPIVYEELPPKQEDTSYKVVAIGRNGGAQIYYPLAFSKRYGI
jgi:hypothetical protein